jgi:hypothetical protein
VQRGPGRFPVGRVEEQLERPVVPLPVQRCLRPEPAAEPQPLLVGPGMRRIGVDVVEGQSELTASSRIAVCSLEMNSPCWSAARPTAKNPRSVYTRPPGRSALNSYASLCKPCRRQSRYAHPSPASPAPMIRIRGWWPEPCAPCFFASPYRRK